MAGKRAPMAADVQRFLRTLSPGQQYVHNLKGVVWTLQAHDRHGPSGKTTFVRLVRPGDFQTISIDELRSSYTRQKTTNLKPIALPPEHDA